MVLYENNISIMFCDGMIVDVRELGKSSFMVIYIKYV